MRRAHQRDCLLVDRPQIGHPVAVNGPLRLPGEQIDTMKFFLIDGRQQNVTVYDCHRTVGPSLSGLPWLGHTVTATARFHGLILKAPERCLGCKVDRDDRASRSGANHETIGIGRRRSRNTTVRNVLYRTVVDRRDLPTPK